MSFHIQGSKMKRFCWKKQAFTFYPCQFSFNRTLFLTKKNIRVFPWPCFGVFGCSSEFIFPVSFSLLRWFHTFRQFRVVVSGFSTSHQHVVMFFNWTQKILALFHAPRNLYVRKENDNLHLCNDPLTL